jgi:hypothetical protein
LDTSQDTTTRALDRRTFALGVLNGGTYTLAVACIDPETLLPAFAVSISDNVIWVGLLSGLFAAGWYWPQIFASRTFETSSALMPHYRISAVVRVFCVAAIPVVVYLWGATHPVLAVSLVSILLLAFSSAGGYGLIPFMTVSRDAMPSTMLGTYFGLRYLLGGLLSFAVGFWIEDVLAESSPIRFPTNYALVFAVGALVFMLSSLLFAVVKERPRTPSRHALSMRMHLVRAWRMVRDNLNMQRLARARVLYHAAVGLSYPFVVPFALKVLGMPPAAVGILLSLKVASYSIANILWGRLSDNRGNREQLIASSGTLLLVPAFTLISPHLPDDALFRIGGTAVTWQFVSIALAIMLVGASASGQLLGFNAFLLEMLPPRRRSTFMGAFYLMVLPTAAVPIIGAAAIGTSDNFALGMIVSGVLGLLMTLQIVHLREVRETQGS